MGSHSLTRFLRHIPPSRRYFSDGAPMYGAVLGTRVLQEKGAMTNLVESFNSQLRQYSTALRRKSKSYAKSGPALKRQLWVLMDKFDWLTPTKLASV